MANEGKKLSNPSSTGSGGAKFEANIQATFVTLMLSGGYAPCLPAWPIVEIKLQGKIADYETDDLIVLVENPVTQQRCKLLGQVKLSIGVTESNPVFAEVIQAAWIDFNNPKVFSKGSDVIALITGPISATDSDGVSGLLEQAQRCKDAEEFIKQVGRARFCSDTVRAKLRAFKAQLRKANAGVELSDEQIFDFLKHFHLLGYDLSRKGSVITSLIQSHIAQFNKEIPDKIWYHIIDEVQLFNKAAGTITRSNLAEGIIRYFKEPVLNYIPQGLSVSDFLSEKKPYSEIEINWRAHSASNSIALANLIGSWDESNENDLIIVSSFVGEEYTGWVRGLRDTLHLSGSPLDFRDGVWSIKDRGKCWEEFSYRVFDSHLDLISEKCRLVLGADDPTFELSIDERYAASVYGKIAPYSSAIRGGLAATLALLGNRSCVLDKCKRGNPKYIADVVVNGLLSNVGWVRWASLNDLIPVLAEASPSVFLSAVDQATAAEVSPFSELFAQEGEGIFGRNYMVGVLWALESLAWDDEYLIAASVSLAEIAALDPGGSWGNRAGNSLVDIFLPWLPHTLASIQKRKVALATIAREQPGVGWRFLLSLLPNQQQTTSGTHKPKWRLEGLVDREGSVNRAEYWEQSIHCAKLLVELAGLDSSRLSELVKKYASLPPEASTALLDKLSSKELTSKSELERYQVWDAICGVLVHHRNFPSAPWSLGEKYLAPLEDVANTIKPISEALAGRRLFSNRDYDLVERDLTYEQQQLKLEELRRESIKSILAESGFQGIVEFSSSVPDSQSVGQTLATIDSLELDREILPSMLDESGRLQGFVKGYAWVKCWKYGWGWFDRLDKVDWALEEIVSLLCMLPFNEEAWSRGESLLGDDFSRYWLKTPANVFQMKEGGEYAIGKLLGVGRAGAALEVVSSGIYLKWDLDSSLVCKVLLAYGAAEPESDRIDGYRISEIIKKLQEDFRVDLEDLSQVEWMYVTLLDRNSDVSPVTLERKLSSSPEFFCELVRAIYSPEGLSVEFVPTVEERNIAVNAYRLLNEWSLVPGGREDGSFDSTLFTDWVAKVDRLSRTSGHFDVAMNCLGSVLIYAPEGCSLWVDEEIAKLANEKERDALRDGYAVATFNSRGVHWVDPEGKPERELAQKYRDQAEALEYAGYHRFAKTVRDISKDYDIQAERNISRFGK
ncbi:hypothetical protein M2D07_014275 [Pseudomonas sp. BGr12]|uniref:hypothetical protein n=1 Tax=Pseudomonas sp. BGr12 TaxID=2936269 RepID=UPI0025594DBC|nr:hypothetical protein [Pseudomonas sp. BJa5]MDL2428182.1 hypothetical protein [Pseudomonas sp. BJa5]